MDFFAGINTEKGYKSYLEDYFKDCKRVYIIKGTSGSGKSTLMKTIAEHREGMGERVVRIKCSSDPLSLDGVLLPDKGIAVCDGTSPHVVEPKLPLVRDVLVDVGVFCRKEQLDREKIVLLSAKKADCYKRAYMYINAGVMAERAAALCVTENSERLWAYCSRFYKKQLASGLKGKASVGVISAFTASGVEVCDGFMPETLFTVKHGGSFLEIIKSLALSSGEKVTLCPHHTDSARLYGIYFHGSGTLVTEGKEDSGKTLNLSRYLTKSGDYKGALAVRTSAYEAARKELESARKFHMALENEYSPAMDFEKLSRVKAQLIRENE